MSIGRREKERCCVLIPGFREEGRIGKVVQEVREYCPDVLVVDDGSPDNTAEEARAAGAHVIVHEQNRGKGVALNTACDYANQQGFSVVITMDADGQHAPSDVPVFIGAYVRTGIPVLVGNRMGDPKGMPFVRKITNRYMSWLLSREMGQYIPDTQCGFRLYRCDVVSVIRTGSERYAAESETLLRLADRGIRMDSVPIKVIYNDSTSKINPVVDTLRFFAMLRKHRRSR